jgi:hypothetical protein
MFGGVISRLIQKMPKYPTVLILILVNLVPLYGVVFWGWSQGYILFIYWAETSIIGFLNVFRMMLAQKVNTKNLKVNGKRPKIKTEADFRAFRRNMIFFFIMHFGIFNVVHGAFVYGFSDIDLGVILSSGTTLIDIAAAAAPLLIPIMALFISHAASFVFNYIGRGEYKEQELNVLFLKPYSRIVVTHITLVSGASLMESFGEPVVMLVLMVVLKIAFDVLAHVYAHENLKQPQLRIG